MPYRLRNPSSPAYLQGYYARPVFLECVKESLSWRSQTIHLVIYDFSKPEMTDWSSRHFSARNKRLYPRFFVIDGFEMFRSQLLRKLLLMTDTL